MKTKIFTFIRIITFLLLFLFAMLYLSYVLTASKLDEYPSRNQFFQTMRAEEDNSIDVLFVGDSTIMHAVNPIQIWDDCKITSFMMSYSMMKSQEAYFDLKKVFEVQSPKVVFLDDAFLFNTVDIKKDYGFEETQNFVDYCSEEIQGIVDYYLPVMKYKSVWRSRGISDLIKKHPEKINSYYKGYKFESIIEPYNGTHNIDTNSEVEYYYAGNYFAKKIAKLCNDSNCQLVIVTFPHGCDWSEQKLIKVKELANECGAKYIDYDSCLEYVVPNFSWQTDTMDGGGHLNYSGATKITTLIENYLLNNLSMKPTKLSVKQNEKWYSDSKEFHNAVIENN